MLTKNIIELLTARPNLRAGQIAEILETKKTIITCTLNYLFKRKLILRDVAEKSPVQMRGRRFVFIYRANNDSAKNEHRVDVGQSRAISNEEGIVRVD